MVIEPLLTRRYSMKVWMEERCEQIADYVIQESATVRQAAKKFGVSKSTVHKDLTERIQGIDRSKAGKVKCILETNKRERSIRGGMATKKKYQNSTESKE